jgi:hypothetical protein
MAKTGPTPTPGADARRRVASPQSQHDRVQLPEAPERWGLGVEAAYEAYRESEAAGLLREEDLAAVARLFDRLDQLARMEASLPEDAADLLKAMQAIRLLDGMIARQMSELGIGPLARTRLGLGGQPRVANELDEFMAERD